MSTHHATRRRYLQVTGGAAAATLAGCLGGDSSDEGMEEEMTDGDEVMSEGEMTEGGMDDGETMATTFSVTIENVSTGDTLGTSEGSVAVPLSPGVNAVHSAMATMFTPGEAATSGLESLAEDGMPSTLASEVEGADGVDHSGAFTTPTGADEPAPLLPGETYTFEVSASAGADPSLSLATMFVQSNDLFYAPGPDGVALFEDGSPVEGYVTDAFTLWDAGTEVNQEPGDGADQAPRQAEAGAGEAEDGVVRRIEEVDDGFDYPPVADVLRVTVTTM